MKHYSSASSGLYWILRRIFLSNMFLSLHIVSRKIICNKNTDGSDEFKVKYITSMYLIKRGNISNKRVLPCIFPQPISSAYFFVSCYCLWHQISQPKPKLNLTQNKTKERLTVTKLLTIQLTWPPSCIQDNISSSVSDAT